MTKTPQISTSKLVVSFRGSKIEIPLHDGLTVGQAKEQVAAAGTLYAPETIKLLIKGKAQSRDDDDKDLRQLLYASFGANKKIYRIMATGGMSVRETEQLNAEAVAGIQKHARNVRDDLTRQGRAQVERRKLLGQAMLREAANRDHSYEGFGSVQVLPNLPDQGQARNILNTLANDPGVLACMKKHGWHVGQLSELYPEGNVGESEVCLMGLNKNHGQEILLRIRTDDLKGFRKMLSIRKVLYHELAHNVHSGHGNDFYKLMRQIERECTELDWTKGAGITEQSASNESSPAAFDGGAFRLGSQNEQATAEESTPMTTLRERMALAAISRQQQQRRGGERKMIKRPSSSISRSSSQEEFPITGKESNRDDAAMNFCPSCGLRHEPQTEEDARTTPDNVGRAPETEHWCQPVAAPCSKQARTSADQEAENDGSCDGQQS